MFLGQRAKGLHFSGWHLSRVTVSTPNTLTRTCTHHITVTQRESACKYACINTHTHTCPPWPRSPPQAPGHWHLLTKPRNLWRGLFTTLAPDRCRRRVWVRDDLIIIKYAWYLFLRSSRMSQNVTRANSRIMWNVLQWDNIRRLAYNTVKMCVCVCVCACVWERERQALSILW